MTYKAGRRRRADVVWQLGRDRALIWRQDAPLLVDLEDATPVELETGIASVEALALHVLNRFQTQRRAYIDPVRREDAVAFLIEHSWIEACRFNGKGRLGGFVTGRLLWRLMDWYRIEYKHGGEVSIDAPTDDPDVDPIEIVVHDAHDLTRESLTPTSRALYDLIAGGYSTAEIGRAYGAKGRLGDAARDLAALKLELAALDA